MTDPIMPTTLTILTQQRDMLRILKEEECGGNSEHPLYALYSEAAVMQTYLIKAYLGTNMSHEDCLHDGAGRNDCRERFQQWTAGA